MITMVFDNTNRMWSDSEEYNKLFLKCQETYFRDMLKADGYVLFLTVLNSLGFNTTLKDAEKYCSTMWRDGDEILFGVYQKGSSFVLNFNLEVQDDRGSEIT